MSYTAKQSNVTVPVAKNGNGYCVAWRERVGAKRTRRTFTDYGAACRFADETALRIANGMKRGLGMTDAQVAEYLAICRECGDTPAITAVREWASARRVLGGLSILEAATAHAAKNPTVATMPTTSDLVAQLITKLERRRSSRTYTAKLRADLLPFAAEFPNLRETTTVAIEEWLAALVTKKARTVSGYLRPVGSPVSTRRRDNVREAITTLFSHAQDAGLLAPGTSAAARVPKIDHGPDEVGIYTPDQMARILDWFALHELDYLPWIVLGAFAGMRSSEIERLQWSAFDWHGGVIKITKLVAAKVKKGRKAPILPALVEWLRPWSHLASGPVIPVLGSAIAHPSRNLARRRERMCADIGLPYWEPNALRHSYASYRRCTHTAAVVAEEMGSSVAMIKKHYDNQPSPTLATAYFESLRPEQPTNIRHIQNA